MATMQDIMSEGMKALGETVVTQRLANRELDRLTRELAEARAQLQDNECDKCRKNHRRHKTP